MKRDYDFRFLRKNVEKGIKDGTTQKSGQGRRK